MLREQQLMSKAELARKAGLSTLTIDRVEAGRACRLDTKRKILIALGMKVSDKSQVFGALFAKPSAEGRQEPVVESAQQMARDEAMMPPSRPAGPGTNPRTASFALAPWAP